MKVSHLLWCPSEGTNFHLCCMCVWGFWIIILTFLFFATFHWGVCIPKEFAKVMFCFVCVCVCEIVLFWEWRVLHPFGASSKSSLLWETEGRGWKRNRLILSFFLLATQRRENTRPQDHIHRMRNWLCTYLLNLKKNVGHCCNNQLHHTHIWRIFAIPCSLQQ